MLTVSEKEKCICIWGNFETVDPNIVSKYKDEGYTIVKLSNGSSSIRDCLKTVARSSNFI